jgi:hypothetical protein
MTTQELIVLLQLADVSGVTNEQYCSDEIRNELLAQLLKLGDALGAVREAITAVETMRGERDEALERLANMNDDWLKAQEHIVSAESRLSSAVLWHSFAAEGAPTTPGRYLVAYVAEGFDHLCVTDEALEDFDFVEPVYWAEFKLPVVETHAKGCTRPRPHSGPCDDGIGELAPAVEAWSLGRSDVKEAYENYKPPTLESTGGVWKFDVENRDHKSERKTFRDPAKTAVESQKQFGSSRWDLPEVKAEEAEKTAAMRGRVDALLDATCKHGKKVREWCDECEKALGRM